MSNARNLADLIASGGVIEASEIADSTITGGKLASDITISTTGTVTAGDATISNDISVNTSTSSVPVYSAGIPSSSDTKLTDDVVKFGTTSLRVGESRSAGHETGSSQDWLMIFDDDDVTSYMDDDANNDFTIELWFYDNTLLGSDPEASSLGHIISVAGQFTVVHSHDYSSPPSLTFGVGSNITTTSGTASDEWHHIAIVNQSGLKTCYLDGTLVGSATTSWGPVQTDPVYDNNIRLGNAGTGTYNRRRFNGFIDGFRISSTARYTSAFTPPTEAFTKDGDTLLLMNFEGDVDSQNQFLVESVNDTTTDAGVFVDGSVSRLGVNNLTPTEAIDVVGTIKATSFSGDGSSLTRVGTTWESKSANFTAASRTAYFVDTSGGAITATLPASPSTGDEIRFLDVAGTFDTNNLTVARNGNPIQGDASDMTVSTERAGFALVFYNSTQGWLLKDV